MSSMHSIGEQGTFFAGTLPHVFMAQWNPTIRPVDAMRGVWTVRWTTPTFHHEISVVPQQGTATDPCEMQGLLERAICHWLVDHLPIGAYDELLPMLVDMRAYYAGGGLRRPQLGATKPLKRLTRSTRPDVDFPEE